MQSHRLGHGAAEQARGLRLRLLITKPQRRAIVNLKGLRQTAWLDVSRCGESLLSRAEKRVPRLPLDINAKEVVAQLLGLQPCLNRLAGLWSTKRSRIQDAKAGCPERRPQVSLVRNKYHSGNSERACTNGRHVRRCQRGEVARGTCNQVSAGAAGRIAGMAPRMTISRPSVNAISRTSLASSLQPPLADLYHSWPCRKQ